jgi:hypothetical protein
MTAKIYRGVVDDNNECQVTIVEGTHVKKLPLRLDIDNHSPDGFSWGYGGSGPAQLALAMLADALRDDRAARVLHQQFKWRHIAPLAINKPWEMTAADVIEKANAIALTIPDFADRIASPL